MPELRTRGTAETLLPGEPTVRPSGKFGEVAGAAFTVDRGVSFEDWKLWKKGWRNRRSGESTCGVLPSLSKLS
jgi:hypothetical protein